MTSALAEPHWCVCSACLGTPAVFPLSVMQLTQVGCSTPAVMVSHGVGGCLVTVVLFPPCFIFCAYAASPSAASPSGLCLLPSGLACLSPVCWSTLRCGWRGLAATFSSVPVRCFPCCRYMGIFWASPAPLTCWGGWGFAPCVMVFWLRCCLLGLQVGVPLLPFPYLRVGVLLAKASPEFVGYEGGFGCPSWFFILFRCLLVHLRFLELGWFLVTRWWLLLRLLVLVSSDARSHIPDAFASSSTPIYGSWMVLAPGRVGAAPSTWVPLLWPGCVGFLPPCSFSSVFLRDVVTLSGH